MKEQLRNILPIIVIAGVFSLFSACSCNCGKDTNENMVKGYITVVGNEPFTKLAIKTDDNKIYTLRCSKEMKENLLKQQGNFYYIKYVDLLTDEGDTAIVVEKVIPLTKDDK